jgi:hypothetical protein
MRRAIFFILLPLAAAAGSIFNLIHFKLSNLLDPSPDAMVNAVWWVALALIVGAAVVPIALRRNVWLLLLALVLIAGVGFAPRFAQIYVDDQKAAAELTEGAAVELEFQTAYLEQSDDLAARIEAKTPYTGEEALTLLEFAADADLSWRSLPDHTPEAFALIDDAIAGGILDPNALMTMARAADSPAVTVTLAFYEKRIRPTSPRTIEAHDWDVLQKLVAAGADTSMADASSLRADLARQVVRGPGRFIELR